jgi:hypothetical protein
MAVAFITSCASMSGTDDILAIIPKRINNSESPKYHRLSTFLTVLDLIKAIVDNIWIASSQLGVSLNLTESTIQQMYQNGFLLRCLSFQYILGLGRNSRMNPSSKLAWICLNMKMISLNFLQCIGPKSDASKLQPGNYITAFDFQMLTTCLEVVMYLLGSVRWALDILVYCIQEIFDMTYDLSANLDDLPAIRAWSKSRPAPASTLLIECTN